MKTTQERIEDLEQQVKNLSGTPNIQMEAAIENLNANMNLVKNQTFAKLTNFEATLGEIAKMLMAVSQILIQKEIISNDEVLSQKQENEDQQEEMLVDALLRNGSIESDADPINPTSLVVVSRSDFNVAEPEKTKVASRFLVVDLSSPLTKQELRDDLSGKTVGDKLQYKTNQEDIFSVFTVKSVYKPKQLSGA
jgi:hypothetical protein